uniref:NADH-ubiquinone oxidoreductase chain 5 n=1 Tax=Modiolus nipponicus TaxID=182714 RepID=A0A516EZI7_MODNI|nr:NADH dehydrogenase subunit 5 [Modiolus nipponicus]QDO71915.1 NADH dehydrogenase subunit 5 [Modiolus nipponicus]
MVQFSKVVGSLFLGVGVFSLLISSQCPMQILEWSLWFSYSFGISFSILLDCSSFLFISTVMMISGSVMVYCSWYMSDEVYYNRFVLLVLLFVGSMVFLITIPNLVCVLIGWDGLGITSFLLVIYYQNNKSLGAGMVTALVNRIGDVLLLFIIGSMMSEGGWLLYENSLVVENLYLPIVLVVGAITKSAQMPFSAWLPAAMAAPTPVSSLVHSSTLVTAGVYLLLRCSSVLEESGLAMNLLKSLSLVTLVMAGSAALVEIDLKKVIALSTLSQLSMMLFSLSLGLTSVCFFHLVAHASFKALLFLCAGVVIHSNFKTQDIRCLGKSWSVLPVSMAFLTVANMSLCGVPFLSGFYSKDMIIELSFMVGDNVGVYMLEILGTLFTSWYSLRLMLNLMFGLNKGISRVSFGEENVTLKMAYFSLAVMSVGVGWVVSQVVVSLSNSVHLFLFDKSLAMGFIPLAGLVYWFSLNQQESVFWKKEALWFLSSMWNLKSMTTQLPSKFLVLYSDVVLVSLEKGWLEKVGPQGAVVVLKSASKLAQTYQQYQFLRMALASGLILASGAMLSALI